MRRTLHIIASCSDRKRVPAPATLRLGSITETDPLVRLARWWERLQTDSSKRVAARDLYVGDHWSVVRGLETTHPAFDIRLWVASAGYGLVSADAPLHGYSATFVNGHVDSVAPSDRGPAKKDVLQAWWDALSDLPGPERFESRSLASLASRDREACLLVVASPQYVCAMENDLVRTAQTLANVDHLIVVTSKSGLLNGALTRHLVYSDARLQHAFGGARQSLNARLARDIVEIAPHRELSAAWCQRHYARFVDESHPTVRWNRAKLTDDEVIAFIGRALTDDPSQRAGRLLRLLRDSGRACEQARFRALYVRVRRALSEPVYAA